MILIITCWLSFKIDSIAESMDLSGLFYEKVDLKSKYLRPLCKNETCIVSRSPVLLSKEDAIDSESDVFC